VSSHQVESGVRPPDPSGDTSRSTTPIRHWDFRLFQAGEIICRIGMWGRRRVTTWRREAWGLPLQHESPAPIPHPCDWRMSLGGHQVSAAIPIGIGERGNMTVYFEVLSYAGVLTTAVIVDPDHGPNLDDLSGCTRSWIRSSHRPSPPIYRVSSGDSDLGWRHLRARGVDWPWTRTSMAEQRTSHRSAANPESDELRWRMSVAKS
jgi:uncharacterized protein DUF1298